jgi:hypothetical protein
MSSYPQGKTPQTPTRKQVKPLHELESDINYIVTENRKSGIDDQTLDTLIDSWIDGELALIRNYLKEYANNKGYGIKVIKRRRNITQARS